MRKTLRTLHAWVAHFEWLTFFCFLLILYFGHWLSTTTLKGLEHLIRGWPHRHPWLISLLSALLLTLFVMLLQHMQHSRPRPRSIPQRLGRGSLATLILVLAFWSATWAERALLGIDFIHHNEWAFALACLAGLVVAARALGRLLPRIEGPEDLQPKTPGEIHQTGFPADPPRTLVLHVSLLFNHQQLEFPESGPFAVVTISGKPYVLLGKSLEDDIQALDGSRWPWQQLLRAIFPHLTLQKVILIGSKANPEKDIGGSFDQLSDCSKLIEKYLPQGCQIVKYPVPLSFEIFNDVKHALRDLIAEEAKHAGEGRVSVDVTGGQATTSIAAAAATIGTQAIFQYVQTNKDYDVLYYDLHQAHAPDPHVHP